MRPDGRGVGVGLLRLLLLVLSWIYRLVLLVRRAAYGLGLRRPTSLSCPVVSVGNLTAGGTQKTPVVEWLARALMDRGREVAILSRGYGGEDVGELNDEGRVLRRGLPGVSIVQNPSRVSGGRRAIREGADCLILDDGFQHWPLARDLDILLIDGTRPFGYGYLLPRGLLREPVGAAQRADLLFLTRAESTTPDERARIEERLGRPFDGTIETRVTGVRPLGGNGEEPESVEGRSVLIFSGLGNPQAFEATAHKLGFDIVETRVFPDHHAYEETEIEELVQAAIDRGAEALVTTRKDAVKLAARERPLPIWVVDIEVAVAEGRSRVDEALEKLLECEPAEGAEKKCEAPG